LVDKINIIAVIIGVLCLISGTYMINDTTALIKRSQQTTATVVGYKVQADVYYPIFNFRDQSGLVVTAQSAEGSTSRIYRIGGSVPILYDPLTPQIIRLNKSTNLWLGPLFLTTMGAFIMVLSLALIWKNKSTKTIPPSLDRAH
jgi:hypothetical protein